MAITFQPLLFSGLTLGSSGGAGSPTIGGPVIGADPNAILITDSSSNLQDVVLTNGQVLIGSTGSAPVAATITGTTNQLIVTNGAGSITLSLPQDIATTSSVSFANVTVSSASQGPARFDNTGKLVEGPIGLASSDVSGILPIANGGTATNTVPATGQLLIGNGTNYTVARLTGTANQVLITNGAGSITLALPQDLATTSSPTFSNVSLSPSGALDITSTGTLAIGTSNANIINIGNSGATINIQGNTFYQNVTDLNVADKNITVNHGGSAGSASNAGLQIEENGSITGYAETSSDRNSWQFLAPNTAGIVTVTPGASGFTINQGSHDPLTLAAVGSTPTANGATLSGQVLTLQPASGTQPGVITTSAQAFSGLKTFQQGVTLNNTTTATVPIIDGTKTLVSSAVTPTELGYLTGVTSAIQTQLNGKASTDLSNLASTAVNADIIPNASGTLNLGSVSKPWGSVVTNSVFAPFAQAIDLTTGRLVDSNGATQLNFSSLGVSLDQLTPNTVPYLNASKIFTSSAVTPTELGYVSGVTSSIQTQLNSKLSPVTGDIAPTTFTGLANNTANQTITGLTFATTVSSFECLMNVQITASSNTWTTLKLLGTRKNASNWSTYDLEPEFTGDSISGLAFTMTSAGQVQVTIGNITGFSSASIKFRAIVLS